jgi:hypothetical protein
MCECSSFLKRYRNHCDFMFDLLWHCVWTNKKYVLLANINNDAQVVPWSSPANVLSAKHSHHILNYDRELAAIQTAERMLWQANPNNWQCVRHHAMHRSYLNSGPARPPLPQDSAIVTYEPCKRPFFLSSCDRLNPPVFGVRALFLCSVLGCADWSD